MYDNRCIPIGKDILEEFLRVEAYDNDENDRTRVKIARAITLGTCQVRIVNHAIYGEYSYRTYISIQEQKFDRPKSRDLIPKMPGFGIMVLCSCPSAYGVAGANWPRSTQSLISIVWRFVAWITCAIVEVAAQLLMMLV